MEEMRTLGGGGRNRTVDGGGGRNLRLTYDDGGGTIQGFRDGEGAIQGSSVAMVVVRFRDSHWQRWWCDLGIGGGAIQGSVVVRL